MRKLITLTFILSLFFLAACDTQSKDELKPNLTLMGETTRTVTGSSVTVEGELSDNTKVTVFSYSLNNATPKNILPDLKGKSFKFVVDGLKDGENNIALVASDAARNQIETKLSVRVEIPVTPTTGLPADISGLWGNQQTPYTYCGDSFNVTVIVNLKQNASALTGVLNIGFFGDVTTFQVQGDISEKGLVTGTATGESNHKIMLNLQLENDTLKGNLTFKEAYSCTGQEFEDFVLPVVLQKGVDLPPPPADDALEPNDTREQASPVSVNSAHDLIFTHLNADWFTFTLDKAQMVTAKITNSLNLTGEYTSVILYDEQGNFVFGGNSPDNINVWTLQAGTYYLELTMGISDQPSVDYRLELSTRDLPDAAYEPNDTLEKATPLGKSFSSSLYLFSSWGSRYDEDVFTFTLSEEGVVSFDLGNVQGLNYHLFAKGQETNTYARDYTEPFSKGLVTGTYYIRFSLDRSVPTLDYTLNFEVKAIPDKNNEPNNSLNTATSLILPVNQQFYLGSNDQDWYSFALSEEKVVTFTSPGLLATGDSLDIVIYNQDGQELNREFFVTNGKELAISHLLPKGQYYATILTSTLNPRPVSYTLSIQTETLPDIDLEPNGTLAQATPIELEFNRNLFLIKQESDIFKITLSTLTQLTIDIETSTWGIFYRSIFDSNDNFVQYLVDGSQDVTLKAGTYYLKISSSYDETKYRLAVRKK